MIPTIIAIYLFAVGYGIFRRFNMGLARNSRGQQLRRYLIAAVQVVIPMLLMRQSSFSLPAVCALLTATLWIVTYNVLYDKTNRQTSPDYDNHMDIAFGIYISDGCRLCKASQQHCRQRQQASSQDLPKRQF